MLAGPDDGTTDLVVEVVRLLFELVRLLVEVVRLLVERAECLDEVENVDCLVEVAFEADDASVDDIVAVPVAFALAASCHRNTTYAAGASKAEKFATSPWHRSQCPVSQSAAKQIGSASQRAKQAACEALPAFTRSSHIGFSTQVMT